MAKQTFTTGQVLTAAQMTSLQQTAMGGGAATAKTASYVLVAADAGTTVAMNAAGATTITVNTGLFAAGDTVFIQNLGAGACTVTAGTATVATAGSLILPQNDAGILYFTSASAAIFYDYIQAGAVSPLTTKGDLYTFSTSDARLAVGANGTTLVADSAQATGLKWATASSGALTLIQRSTFSGVAGTSTTFDGVFTSTYVNYLISIENLSAATIGDDLQFIFRVSGSDASNHYGNCLSNLYNSSTISNTSSSAAGQLVMFVDNTRSDYPASGEIYIGNVGTTIRTSLNGYLCGLYDNAAYSMFYGGSSTAATYTGFRLKTASSNISGTVAVYGLAKS